MNIGDITAKWANLDADRPALVDIPTGRRLSFGELEQAVRRLANGLLDLGLAKGDRVAVLAKNGIEYFEVYYACAPRRIDCPTLELAAGRAGIGPHS